jgi:hypothetical protein
VKSNGICSRHGQVMWLLTELGYSDAVSRSTFHEYVKSLRKLGIPFGRMKFQTKHRRRLADYSYCHVMELAITLSLRVYHVVPDSVLREIIRYRSRLRNASSAVSAASASATLRCLEKTDSRPPQ